MIKLNQEKLPDCYLHRTAVNDVARVEDRTFICTRKEEDAGPTNHWMDPQKCYKMLYDIARGSYKGRTMYVIPYSMGPVGSPFSKIGVELTDSIYVVLNMSIMTRVGQKVLDTLGDSNDWVRGLHCKCQIDAEKRYICHFPEDNTIISVNSGYGGNVLLGKKCFALRIASYLGKNEGWMAEHMLILGIQNPKGEIKYVAAAFPSACGKTNLAMLIPPEVYRKKGYKVWTVGDDIAWMRIGPDGRLWAINPENGFFGVAPGTNEKSNPNALATTKSGTIFTNVAQNLTTTPSGGKALTTIRRRTASTGRASRGTAQPPTKRALIRTAASPLRRRTARASAPNSTSARACRFPPSSSAAAAHRPLRWSISPATGTTACSSAPSWLPKQPPPQPAPSALSAATRWPCCRSAATTWATISQHWLDMGKKLGDKAPKIFNVNWFRLDDEGNFIWPGFGDNLRVLEWILNRCEGKADAVETPIGYVPKAEDINLEGLDLSLDTLKGILEDRQGRVVERSRRH